jgi:hypothetical protein
VLIPHGSLERPPEQDYDRFLFSSYGHFFSLTSFSSSSSSAVFFFTRFVIVVGKVGVVVLDTTHDKVFLFFYFLSFFFEKRTTEHTKKEMKMLFYIYIYISGLGRRTHKIRTQKKGRREIII